MKYAIALLLMLTTLLGEVSADQYGETRRNIDNAFSDEVRVKALLAAYPGKIGEVFYRSGDWTIAVADRHFRWAGGRLLPAVEPGGGETYSPHPFYPYPSTLPKLPKYSDAQKNEIEERVGRRENSPPARRPDFYNSLWRIYDEKSAWQRMKTIYFMGRKVLIHRDLIDELAAIEEELFYEMENDATLRQFIQSLGILEGYVWRSIAGTASLSIHSYGAAIDFIPGKGQTGEAYWRWAKERHSEWYSLPYERRFMPPDSFVRAFEKRGFIWGGKWFYFDTMHFEYRPEILALSGYKSVYRASPVTGFLERVWIPPSGS